MSRADTICVIALAGNPNVGKSTLFNRITGLRQHTGNWPGKTVEIAQGTAKADGSVRVVDLPGAYCYSNGWTWLWWYATLRASRAI